MDTSSLSPVLNDTTLMENKCYILEQFTQDQKCFSFSLVPVTLGLSE